MATYTHTGNSIPTNILGFPSTWGAVLGSSYVATSSHITITNKDGTLTSLSGNFLTVVGGSVVGGNITTMSHTSSNGAITYETITGMSTNAAAFLSAPNGDAKLALALPGTDTLNGYAGDDYLNGYAGKDTMAGGAGNDRYYVDNSGDVVTEQPNAGHDIVFTTLADYTLPANVENLGFAGSGAHVGTGNERDNVLSGSSGKDTLHGLDGNDYFNSFGGGDTFYGGLGDDTYDAVAGDVAIELPGEGIDQVIMSLATFVLPANIENIEVRFNSVQAYGNELDNKITITLGSGGALFGLGGNDTLKGGIGSNTLYGGPGDDTAVFSNDLSAYAVKDFGTSIAVSEPGGTDTLSAIEHLRFADGTVNVDDGNLLFDTVYYMNSQPGRLPRGRERARTLQCVRPARSARPECVLRHLGLSRRPQGCGGERHEPARTL